MQIPRDDEYTITREEYLRREQRRAQRKKGTQRKVQPKQDRRQRRRRTVPKLRPLAVAQCVICGRDILNGQPVFVMMGKQPTTRGRDVVKTDQFAHRRCA